MLLLSALSFAAAHDGHDHGPAESGVPRRLPDGTVSFPKAAQHLLGIRTVVAKQTPAARTTEFAGRVIADPNALGRVQAIRDGRIEPGQKGFPHLGQEVKQGEVLATLVPTLSAFEETQLRQSLIQVEREMQSLVPRAESIGQVNPNMPMSDTAVGMLQDLQLQSQALTRQLDLIKSALAQKIEIKAPVSGLVTAANVTAGQLVAARDTLFELVDREKLLIEAYSFDSAAANGIAAATATTEDGRQLRLVSLGRGRMLQQQAMLLRFRITEGAAGVTIGTPVRLVATGQAKTRGIALPRAAVQRGSGNLPVVWEQTGAEIFVSHKVSVAPLDADHVLVTEGIVDGARLVTSGAQFINQVR